MGGSVDTPVGVVCENGVGSIDSNAASAINALKEEVVEGLDKNFTKTD